jgi:hypothetical protein
MKTIFQEFTTLLAQRIESKGFKKRAGGIFTKELCNGFIGLLGLNHSTHKLNILVNPVIGIRCQELELLVSKISQTKPHKYLPATVSISLGYLTPEQTFRSWVYGELGGDECLSDLTEALSCYAIPFMVSNSELSKIDALLESPKFSHYDHLCYRRPLVRMLLGDTKGGILLCDNYTQRIGDRTDMAADQFRQFARGFESLVKQVDA